MYSQSITVFPTLILDYVEGVYLT